MNAGFKAFGTSHTTPTRDSHTTSANTSFKVCNHPATKHLTLGLAPLIHHGWMSIREAGKKITDKPQESPHHKPFGQDTLSSCTFARSALGASDRPIAAESCEEYGQ